MDLVAMIKSLVEANGLIKQLQQDAKEIEGSSIDQVLEGWHDLSYGVYNDYPEFKDILDNPYATAKGYIAQVANAAEGYMQGVTLQVERPNYQPGGEYSQYINLYEGTVSKDSDGYINENFAHPIYDNWGNIIGYHAATLWDAISNPSLTLCNDSSDAYWNNAGGRVAGMGCDWAHGNFSWQTQNDDPGDESSAQGTGSQWSPYLHFNGGNANALNQAVFLA